MTATHRAASMSAPAAAEDCDPSRIGVLTRGITGGGVQRMSLNVAAELVERGWQVDLLSRKDGDRSQLPHGVRLIVLPARSRTIARALALRADPAGFGAMLRPVLGCAIGAEPLRYLSPLRDYLVESRPAALLSATTYLNLVALWARRLAGTGTRVLVSERDSLSANLTTGRSRRAWRGRHAPALLARAYPEADAIVAVSNGVADDLAQLTGIARPAVRTIYNPVVPPDIGAKAAEPIDEPWLEPGQPPVVLSAGRLVKKKQYGVLLQSIAALREQRPVRLIILGEGPERARIEAEARRLGIADDVRLVGWCDNPYAYMSRAAAFALTSDREGFGNVLVEAMRCGAPVVATDCPSGPGEILDGGKYGALVPVGDVAAIAIALRRMLDEPQDRNRFRRRGGEFTVERAVDAYLEAVRLPARPASGERGTEAVAQ